MVYGVEPHRTAHPQRLEGELKPRQGYDAQLVLRDRIATAERMAVVADDWLDEAAIDVADRAGRDDREGEGPRRPGGLYQPGRQRLDHSHTWKIGRAHV